MEQFNKSVVYNLPILVDPKEIDLKRVKIHFNLFMFKFKDTIKLDENGKEAENNLACYGCCIDCCGDICGWLTAWVPCCCFTENPYQRVKTGQFGLIEKFGKYQRTVASGLNYVNTCTEKIIMVDMKTNIIDLKRQVVITADNIVVTIDASVLFRIMNPRLAIYAVEDYIAATRYLAVAVIRNVVSVNELQELLEKRIQIANQIFDQVDEYTDAWGINVEQGLLICYFRIIIVFIEDIQIQEQLQGPLASVAKAQRLAYSKLITVKADVEAAKLQKQSADALSSTAAKWFESLIQMAQSRKVIFLPFDETSGVS